MKTALILPTIKPLSYEFWGMTPVWTDIVIPDWDAIPFLPVYESQSNVYFDTYWCVSFSFNNWAETYHKARYWEEPNFSDRDLTVLSWTKPRIGNSWEVVLDTAQRLWLIPQVLWDWDPASRDPLVNIESVYYSYIRSTEWEKAAKRFKEDYEVIWEWVHRSKWKEASKRWVLQVYVQAWHINSKWEYYSPTGRFNHAVMMANYKNRQIYDSYEPRIKTLDSWDSIHPWALKINLIKKNMSKPIIANNSLVILVEWVWWIGLYLDWKIIVDNEAKINSVFMARNSKDWYFSGWPVVSLKQEQWDSFDKYNLKMEKL